MKNIHLIPTDKTSRLAILHDNKLHLGTNFKKDLNVNPQNIYITDNSEIKVGDWCIDKHNVVYKQETDKIFTEFNGGKKIILTTDIDLIADDIQAINDEFLQWFVNNTSCKYIDVKYQYWEKRYTYKIIIPKEEPKQQAIEEAADMYLKKVNTKVHKDLERDGWIKIGFIEGAKRQAERMYSEKELHNAFYNGWIYRGEDYDFPKAKKEWFEQFKKKL
jgi:hypothetical protein